jgi:sulfur-oxidizing protein SoxY
VSQHKTDVDHRPDRRTLLLSAGALALAGAGTLARAGDATAPSPAPGEHPDVQAADPTPPKPTPQYDEAYAKIVGSGTPLEGHVVVEIPEDVENGNIVPYKISVESPMSADDYIDRIYLLSTQNPQATVAVFHFSPQSGKAMVSGRMRLAKTQDVVAVALNNTNTLLRGQTNVAVAIGGCGTE